MTQLDRRGALAAIAAFALVPAAAKPRPAPGEQLYRDVLAYEQFGDHRSGTEADRRTSAWIARRLRRIGFIVSQQPFAIESFEPRSSELRLGNDRLPLFPVWPPRATSREGLSARLGLAPAAGAIAVVPLPFAPNASLLTPTYSRPLKAAVDAGAAAVIGVTQGPTGEIIGLNAGPRLQWPVPVAVARGRDLERLSIAARDGAEATFVLAGRPRTLTAHNVIARRDGIGRTLIVSTPTSGWFRCAGERGTGIALFLDLAQWAFSNLRCPIVLAATSGHEIEGAGSEALLASGLPPPSEVELWLHLGANLAIADLDLSAGARPKRGPFAHRVIGAAAEFVPALAAAFREQPGYATPSVLTPENAVGDIAHWVRAGYARAVGLVGASPVHHTRLDRAAIVTSAELMAPVSQALRSSLGAILGP